jgi:flagellar assembly factor FliW
MRSMPKTANSKSEIIKINSRFGEVTVDTSKAIFFPKGLYGMPENLSFGLVKFPSEKFANFSVLQCLNDYSLSFVVLPTGIKNTFVDENDMLEACTSNNISQENLGVLFIVSVQRTPEKTSLTVNAKAPILIDTTNQTGLQHILISPKYNVKHEID